MLTKKGRKQIYELSSFSCEPEKIGVWNEKFKKKLY